MCCLHAPRFSNGMRKKPQSSSWGKFLGCRCRSGINQACRNIRAVWVKMRHYCYRVHLEQRCHKSNFSKAKSQTRAFFFLSLIPSSPCNFFPSLSPTFPSFSDSASPSSCCFPAFHTVCTALGVRCYSHKRKPFHSSN